MRKLIITFSVFALIAINCFAQNANDDEYINPEIVEFALNESYSIRIRQISEREFNARKNESEHLRHHNNYKVIRDIDEARKLLEDRIRGVKIEERSSHSLFLEVCHNDGVTKTHSVIWNGWHSEYYLNNFIAYFPEVGILIVKHEADGEFLIDFNDSEKDGWHIGNPIFRNPSPNKQWRINGHSPGGAWAWDYYFLEKWNPQKGRFEFISNFSPNSSDEALVITSEEWFFLQRLSFVGTNGFWVSDNKWLFGIGWHSLFWEMEIITNEKN